ncbi:MAG: hypothetical protein HFI09_04810 [Bacilli bacterium]|nr:hypothetical protein [Bacilli bacterium]
MIGAIRTYLDECPFFNNLKAIGVDFLSNDANIASIDRTPIKPLINGKISGAKIKQASFTLRVKLNHSDELKQQIENSDFLEDFEDWLEEQNDIKNFPIFKKNKKVTNIYVSSSNYLLSIDPALRKAVYQVQIIIEYEKKDKNNPFADFF